MPSGLVKQSCFVERRHLKKLHVPTCTGDSSCLCVIFRDVLVLLHILYDGHLEIKTNESLNVVRHYIDGLLSVVPLTCLVCRFAGCPKYASVVNKYCLAEL